MLNASRAVWLLNLAEAHRQKWAQTGDIKLLKIAHDLETEAALWQK